MIRISLFSFFVLLFGFGINVMPVQAVDAVECGKIGGEVLPGTTVCTPTHATTGLSITPIPQILTSIANWIVSLFGAIAIIVLMICGFQYLISAGDDSQAENAKRCMKWAIIGVIVGGAAFVVIKFIAGVMIGDVP